MGREKSLAMTTSGHLHQEMEVSSSELKSFREEALELSRSREQLWPGWKQTATWGEGHPAAWFQGGWQNNYDYIFAWGEETKTNPWISGSPILRPIGGGTLHCSNLFADHCNHIATINSGHHWCFLALLRLRPLGKSSGVWQRAAGQRCAHSSWNLIQNIDPLWFH